MKKLWAARIFGVACLAMALFMAFLTVSYGMAYSKYAKFNDRVQQRVEELDQEWEEKCHQLEEELASRQMDTGS